MYTFTTGSNTQSHYQKTISELREEKTGISAGVVQDGICFHNVQFYGIIKYYHAGRRF